MSINLRWIPTSSTDANIVGSSGKCLGSYHWGPERRHPYFHPLYSYGANESLTCFAPWDHRWHKALWWSWKLINGIIFWENAAQDGAGEGTSRVVAHSAGEQKDGSIEIRQTLEMRVLHTQELYLSEERRLLLHPHLPGILGGWAIDWDMVTTAATRCELSTTPYPDIAWGGYMGLNYRPNRCMGWDETILNSGGQTGHDGCHGRRARWAAYGGNLDGNEQDCATNPAKAGVAILDHPHNLRHPTDFYAWSVGPDNRSFGFLSASPLMRKDLTLETGERLRLRYRTIVFDGPVPVPALNQVWAAYAETVG